MCRSFPTNIRHMCRKENILFPLAALMKLHSIDGLYSALQKGCVMIFLKWRYIIFIKWRDSHFCYFDPILRAQNVIKPNKKGLNSSSLTKRWKTVNWITMFVGRECSSVDVQVRVDFDRCNIQTTALQQRSNATRDNSLANTTDNAASHQYVLHLWARVEDFDFSALVNLKKMGDQTRREQNFEFSSVMLHFSSLPQISLGARVVPIHYSTFHWSWKQWKHRMTSYKALSSFPGPAFLCR